MTNANANATANLLTIASVVPATASIGKQLVVARWKNGTDKIVAEVNRARCIELPADIWALGMNTENKSLELFVADAIAELAKQRLHTICTESNMLRTQVPQELFTLSNLLSWNEEQAAVSGRLNGDAIKAWVLTSATIADVTAKHGKDIGTALGAQFVKLASPNHGLTPEKADKMLTNIWNTKDADDNTGLRVMLRLQAIRDKTVTNTDNILDSIL